MSVFYYDSGMNPGDDACKNAILASPHDQKPRIILVRNTSNMDEVLYGYDVGAGYSVYLKISWYESSKIYKESNGVFVINTILTA